MENVAINITDYLIEKQLLNPDKKEWCVYWVQKKILSLISYLIFFAIAMYNHNAAETLVFVTSLMLLRKEPAVITLIHGRFVFCFPLCWCLLCHMV